MNNPRLATRYAKSIFDLAIEQNQLDVVFSDMKLILGFCKTNPDFVSLLRSPIIKPTTKGKIIESITKGRVSQVTAGFIRLLVVKTREIYLPEIAAAFIDQYNALNNIHKVKITTAVQMNETLKSAILSKAKQNIPGGDIELETAVNEELIGGFILETEGKLLDKSILSNLNEIRKKFLNNDYLYKIR